MCVTSATTSTNVPGSERVTICRQACTSCMVCRSTSPTAVLRKCVAAKVKRISPEAILRR